ncbi:NfeD family protein [Sunxiuqinia elliptica]|uniref:NfeD-like partner-binding protein n=1 Tax=Sunxiuqinia elliptica TaxID=655355 RepID=A0A4R6GKQ6_9BACT|nr:NfeD family protein [Sunxiuqinia elliptica]TDN95702.1 NfeD-like partner-binding protein [Sunxiuqinia elliptica]TDO66897.1 NfeD-like partner-binding protein [Sunxiuqinia elliptica]
MTILIILFLIFLGILLLLLEFVVIPGITIAGIGGVLLLGASVYLAFDTYGVLAGIITLAFVLIVAPLVVYRFFQSRTGKKMLLNSEIDGHVDQIDSQTIHEGDEGITLGRLVPTGKVRINEQIMEAKSATGFVDPNVKIRVIEVLKTQVIVEPINQE